MREKLKKTFDATFDATPCTQWKIHSDREVG